MRRGDAERHRGKIYEDEFVEHLFNRMARTYGITNYISSFGFAEKWRRQCIRQIDWNNGLKEGYDLMSGMGECWSLIMDASEGKVKITGVDISSAMNNKAGEYLFRHPNWQIAYKGRKYASEQDRIRIGRFHHVYLWPEDLFGRTACGTGKGNK